MPPVGLQNITPNGVRTEWRLLNPSTGLSSSGQSSPCDLPKSYDFRGPCKELYVPDQGLKLTFPAYRGLGVSVTIPTNTFDSDVAFGIGTSEADITGRWFSHIFPVFGSKQAVCSSGPGPLHPCIGKGFLYMLFYVPPKSVAGGINNYPEYHITNTGAFPGKTCEEDNLMWAGRWIWVQTGIAAKPVKRSLTFPTYAGWGIGIPNGKYAILGFHCY